jgi:hypothetical protein
MAKSAKKVQAKSDIELVPDAWPRFEKFITEIVKAGPQHRASKPAKSKIASTRRKKPKEASAG